MLRNEDLNRHSLIQVSLITSCSQSLALKRTKGMSQEEIPRLMPMDRDLEKFRYPVRRPFDLLPLNGKTRQ